jgi:uncharacterized SAM-binding protein YcdF (DUF218 family)
VAETSLWAELWLYAAKIAPLFVYPLGLALLLLLFAFGLARHRRAARLVLAVAVLLLWAAASPGVALMLGEQLEAAYPEVAPAEAPSADVAVVLGGVASPLQPTQTVPDFGDAVDRVFMAAALWHAGKVKYVLVSGGNLPWQTHAAPEAAVIAALLRDLGVAPDAIVLEEASATTRENAVNSAALWQQRGFRTGLLVTSASHMPRALAAFRKVGLDLAPVPVDRRAGLTPFRTVFDVLPDSGALHATTSVLKEWIGLAVYRWRGWA